MSKKHVVVITASGVRILTNPVEIPKGALVNPDFSKVLGTPPHHWDCVDGQLVPASSAVIALREVSKVVVTGKSKRSRLVHDLLVIGVSILLSIIAMKVLK